MNLLGGCWTDGPDKLCLVLELCPLGSLHDLLKDSMIDHSFEKTPDRQTYYDITMGIVDCFVYLHHEQIGDPLIHRDLKPANVLIAGTDESDMTAKVADFGESRRFDAKAAEAARDNDGRGDALTMATRIYCARVPPHDDSRLTPTCVTVRRRWWERQCVRTDLLRSVVSSRTKH